MNKEMGNTSEMQVSIASFSGMAYPQQTLPMLALLFIVNKLGNREIELIHRS